MKVRKAIKKIAALGAGITMVGATILGAMAADLSSYPAPFVQSGQFNALIVVGDQAAAQDVVGAVDIGANLQYAMRQETAVTGGGMPVVTISEGKKIDKTGDHLNYGEEIQDILGAPLDDSDLPVILATEIYNDNEGQTDNKEDYDQRLYFYNMLSTNNGTVNKGAGLFTFAADDDGDKKAADYLMFDDGSNDYMFRYKLLFDTSVEYTNTSATDNTPADDLEDTTIRIQGDDYTLIDVQSSSSAAYRIDKLTLLSGETIIWLQQGKTIKRTIGGVEHEIEVTDVNDNEDMCGVSVDGDVVWVDKGNTQTANGVTIGVTDAVAVHAQLQDVDICKLNIGAREIIIDNGKEIKVDGVKVSGSQGDIIAGSIVSQNWDGLNVTYVPQDEEFVPAGGSIVDPIFGKFELRFDGVSKVAEEMTLSTTTDGAEFEFYNNNGDKVTIPLFAHDTSTTHANITLGDDFSTSSCSGRLLLEGDNCAGVTDLNGIEGAQFLLVTSGKEAHVMEISDISTTTTENSTVDLKDLTTGKTYNDKKITTRDDIVGSGCGHGSSIELGSLGTVILNFSASGCFRASDTVLGDATKIETKYGGNLTIVPNWANWIGSGVGGDNETHTTFILLQEEQKETNDLVWNLSVFWYTTDEEVRINAPALQVGKNAEQWNITNVRSSKSDKYTKYYATEWGTLATYDSDNKNDFTLWYPDEQAIGNVFVAPIGATVTGAGGGELTTVTLNPINVAAKLASEIEGQEKTQNLIAVGGPAINKAAAVVMGLEFPATGAASGIAAGTAIIKLYENGNNVAMVVAGYDAADTRRASTVMAHYGDYALTGKEVVVTGTSLSDITVSAPKA